MSQTEQTERYEYTVYVTETRTKAVRVPLEIPAGTAFDRANRKRAEELAVDTEADWSDTKVKSTAEFWQKQA